jgi:predicted nucleotidyltransferase
MHEELHSRIWVNGKLDLEVRSKLLEIAQKFLEFLKVSQEPVDVVFTGSLANFSYTEHSDLDLHVVVDFDKIDCKKEFISEYMLAKKALWNEQHHITIRGFPIEVYTQDVHEPHYSTGVYSVLYDKWLKEPSFTEPEVDRRAIKRKVQELIYDIDSAIEAESVEKLDQITEKLKRMRKSGLEEHGEYSLENLVFKELRHNGTLEKLKLAKIRLTDEELTLSDVFHDDDPKDVWWSF